MEVSKLSGAQLDYWVAKAEGKTLGIDAQMRFMPSTDWSQGGFIIERERIVVWPTEVILDGDAFETRKQWAAIHPESKGLGGWTDGTGGVDVTNRDGMPGATPLAAAMRAYVAAKFGDSVRESDT